jgi:hypothetical protein
LRLHQFAFRMSGNTLFAEPVEVLDSEDMVAGFAAADIAAEDTAAVDFDTDSNMRFGFAVQCFSET